MLHLMSKPELVAYVNGFLEHDRLPLLTPEQEEHEYQQYYKLTKPYDLSQAEFIVFQNEINASFGLPPLTSQQEIDDCRVLEGR